MLATVAAADSANTVRKKYSVFIYSEAEPHAMYAIYKKRQHCVFYSIWIIQIRFKQANKGIQSTLGKHSLFTPTNVQTDKAKPNSEPK